MILYFPTMERTQHVSVTAFSLVLLMLGGCALLSPTDPYGPGGSQVPFEAQAKAIDGAPSEMSADLGKLQLPEIIAIALENNPEVASSAFDVEGASARKDQAKGAMLPSLTAEGDYIRHLNDQRLLAPEFNGQPGTFSDAIYSGGLAVRMPLFRGGRLINEARAAELLTEAGGYRLGRTREILVFNLKNLFFAMLAQEELIESLLFSQEALESHLKRIKDLIAVEKAAKVDRLRTEVQLADIRQKIVAERNALAIQNQRLRNLMGIEAGGPSLELQGTLERGVAHSLSLKEALALAFEKRPDYLAMRKELEAQAKRVDAARAGHSPNVSLFAKYGGRWAANPSVQPTGADDAEEVGSLGIGVDIPLFEGGRIQAKVREERAKLAARQERWRELQLQIRLEVETALRNFRSASERVRTLRKSVEQAEESLRIERQKYGLGRGAIVDVLDSQSALLEAETQYYGALSEVQIARAQIELATGEFQ